jgi:hypothetical protein
VRRGRPSLARREWVYGFAYGNVNAHGWVQNGWFCLGQSLLVRELVAQTIA